MKTKILSLLAIAGLVFFTGCASEDTANKQTEHEPDTEGLTGFVEEVPATRTTAEYDGSGLNFYWTAGDRLWINNGTLMQNSRNNIDSKLENNPANPSAVKRAATATFWFRGTFTANSYPVRYTGKNGVADKVTIKASQTQTIPNDASHIGEDGDFGVATATKPTGGDQYLFTLDHKAAYLTFMPYTNQGVISGAKLQKIRVFTGNTSDALAGTFDLADDGTLSNPASTSNSVELDVSGGSWSGGFSIPSTETYTTNGAIMVVNPGTYNNVSIEYTVHDPVTSITGTITKTYPSVTFTAGKNKKVNTDLQVIVYPGNEYYQWDAQQHYWAGYEWDGANPTQPTIIKNINSTDAPQSSPSVSAHTPRDFNDMMGYTDPTGTAPAVLPTTPHFQLLPNINECIWYAMQGDPHWDKNELWATMGHLYKGGMWFKKKSKISGYNANQAPNGIDYTRSTSTANYNSYATPDKPSNLNDYFFLPPLGSYDFGMFDYVGIYGRYWSSTPFPSLTFFVYGMDFYNGGVTVTGMYRNYGFRLWTAQ